MKWNMVIAYVLIFLFLLTLLSPKSEPLDFIGTYSWVKHEQNGYRTSTTDDLILRFYPRTSVFDIKYNDKFQCCLPFIFQEDSTIIMFNIDNMFFNDTTTTIVKGKLIGINDMKIYAINDTNIFSNEYIYLKKHLPYQY